MRGEFVVGPRGFESMWIQVHADSETGLNRPFRPGLGRHQQSCTEPTLWRGSRPCFVRVIEMRFAVVGQDLALGGNRYGRVIRGRLQCVDVMVAGGCCSVCRNIGKLRVADCDYAIVFRSDRASPVRGETG